MTPTRWTASLVVLQIAGCAALSPEKLLTSKAPNPRSQKSAESSNLPTTPLRAVSSDKVRAEACLQTALELSKAGQHEHAVTQFQRARSFDANLKAISHPLAVCYDRLGQFDDARREYDLALKESPRDAQLLNDVGMHFLQKEDWSQAEHYFHDALKLDARHPRAATNLGIALAEQGHYSEAEAAFAKSATRAAAASNVAMFLARHGQADEAEAKFREALRLEPSLQPAAEGLAWLTSHDFGAATARLD